MLSGSSTAYDRLVEVNFTVSDFQIEFALGVGANPCLVVHCRTLRTEIR